MDGSNINLWEVAKGGWVAAAAVIAWVGGKHIENDKSNAGNAFARLTALELTTVTKTDLARLDGKIDQVLLLLAKQG